MKVASLRFGAVLLLVAVFVSAVGDCGGPMIIDGVTPARVAPGETFTILGRNFGREPGTRIPSVNRCQANLLEVVHWSDEAITVRVPEEVPYWGQHKVLIYYDASFRTSSNSIDFWVTAAPVPETVVDRWEVQVRSFAAKYGKNDEWVTWMIDNRHLWEPTFLKAYEAPCTLTLAYSYQEAPPAYDPPWANEDEHMAAFARMAEAFFPSFRFRMVFDGDPADTYGQIIIIPENASYGGSSVVGIYYEGIFGHEWAHAMGLNHHYATEDDHGGMMNMPPGDTRCTMDRTPPGFCSGGRTALNIPLDLDTSAAEAAAIREIHRRYPPGY